MQAKLWTLSGLAVELAQDRRSLARKLEGLEPDETKGSGARVMRHYRLCRVIEHLYSGPADEALDGNKERARKDREMADKLALENAQTRGEIAPIVEIAEWYGSHVDRCCTRLDQIPDAIGQLCEPRIAALVVPECRRLIHEARAELAIEEGDPVEVAAASD